MDELNKELAQFARSIVLGEAPSPQINEAYANYAVDTAVGVYRNNYRGNLHDALAGAYPVIVQLVGEDFFRYMARCYIGAHPSRSGNLYHYGDKLAEFVADFEPAQGLAYLADAGANTTRTVSGTDFVHILSSDPLRLSDCVDLAGASSRWRFSDRFEQRCKYRAGKPSR
jgi:hypothetical protein